MSEFKREISFKPAFDKRNSDPKKDCGIHGVEMFWTLTGPLGAIALTIFTGWMLDHIEDEMEARTHSGVGFRITRPSAAGVSYHSPKPMYEDQQPSSTPCDLIGCNCYSDTSFTGGDEPFRILKEQGSDAVWKWLENYYAQTLNSPAGLPSETQKDE